MKYPEFVLKAIRTEYPNCHFFLNSEDANILENINWSEENLESFDKNRIETKIAELQAEYDANQYQRDRAAAYPSWQDQLDTIYHQGLDAWKTEIQAIKNQYPKP